MIHNVSLINNSIILNHDLVTHYWPHSPIEYAQNTEIRRHCCYLSCFRASPTCVFPTALDLILAGLQCTRASHPTSQISPMHVFCLVIVHLCQTCSKNRKFPNKNHYLRIKYSIGSCFIKRSIPKLMLAGWLAGRLADLPGTIQIQ